MRQICKFLMVFGVGLFSAQLALADLPGLNCNQRFGSEDKAKINIQRSFGFTQQAFVEYAKQGQSVSTAEATVFVSDGFGFNSVRYSGGAITLEVDLGWDQYPQYFRSYDGDLTVGNQTFRVSCEYDYF